MAHRPPLKCCACGSVSVDVDAMLTAGRILVAAIYQNQLASTTNMFTSMTYPELMKLWSLEHVARRAAACPADEGACLRLFSIELPTLIKFTGAYLPPQPL